MSRVMVTGELPDGGLDALTAGRHEIVRPDPPAVNRRSAVVEAASETDAIISLLTDAIHRDVIAAGAGRLKVIANVAVGYNNIDVRAAAEAVVTVCNTPSTAPRWLSSAGVKSAKPSDAVWPCQGCWRCSLGGGQPT